MTDSESAHFLEGSKYAFGNAREALAEAGMWTTWVGCAKGLMGRWLRSSFSYSNYAPQQDSNLRTRLRRGCARRPLTCGKMLP
jgi:hypothetical protein